MTRKWEPWCFIPWGTLHNLTDESRWREMCYTCKLWDDGILGGSGSSSDFLYQLVTPQSLMYSMGWPCHDIILLEQGMNERRQSQHWSHWLAHTSCWWAGPENISSILGNALQITFPSLSSSQGVQMKRYSIKMSRQVWMTMSLGVQLPRLIWSFQIFA